MSGMNNLVGSLINLFNDTSVVPKPINGYTGSFFYGPNQELVFRNNIPKGKVVPGETFMEEKSFGNGWKYNKNYNVHVDFFTVTGFTDINGYKNADLIHHYFELIEEAVRNHSTVYGGMVVTDMMVEFEPQRTEFFGNNVWAGRKVFVFKERR